MSIDVCNFDSSWSGGPTAWRRAAAIALSYDVQMGHHEEPQIAARTCWRANRTGRMQSASTPLVTRCSGTSSPILLA